MDQRLFRSVGLLVGGALLALGCGGSNSTPSCTPVSGKAEPFPTLDAWCQVSMVGGDVVPNPGVTPYNLNTPLFSDYAVKRRTVWMPPGASATYDGENVFTFPEGTVLTKSFGLPDDVRKAQPVVQWVETRVMWLTGGEWHAVSYTWDQAQTKATVAPGGGVYPKTIIGPDGSTLDAQYLVPQANQCSQCHASNSVTSLIGPKARNLNRDLTYPDGTTENQLAHWTRAPGPSTSAPAPTSSPTARTATARAAMPRTAPSSSPPSSPTRTATGCARSQWPRAAAPGTCSTTSFPANRTRRSWSTGSAPPTPRWRCRRSAAAWSIRRGSS